MKTTQEPGTPLRLERETCTRCGGSGHYSYCQMYGTRCFKCDGRKEVLTKRGAAAAAYLQQLRSRKASELKVGDYIRFDGLMVPGAVCEKPRWTKITEIRPADVALDGGRIIDGQTVAEGLTIVTDACKFLGISPDATYVVPFSKEEQLTQLKQAIEYQNSLTKAGKPRKSRPPRPLTETDDERGEVC